MNKKNIICLCSILDFPFNRYSEAPNIPKTAPEDPIEIVGISNIIHKIEPRFPNKPLHMKTITTVRPLVNSSKRILKMNKNSKFEAKCTTFA